MTRLFVPHISLTLRHLFGRVFANFFHRLAGFGSKRKRDAQPISHRCQPHFSALDDQLLADLGLQRSEIRAAEYGILPGDQALHHTETAQSPDDGDAATRPQT